MQSTDAATVTQFGAPAQFGSAQSVRPLQSLSMPSLQISAGGLPQSSGQLQGVSPGSHVLSPQNDAAPFTALNAFTRPEPSNPIYAGFCALILSAVSRTWAQTC